MAGEIRNDLNGLRVQLPGNPAIYLIDNGRKRHIPSPPVYNQLFSTWAGVIQDIDVNDIELGEAIPNTAILFRCSNSPAVFLLDGNSPHQIKRHIASPAVMDRYSFDWNKIHVFNVNVDDLSWPNGPQITNP